VQHENVEVISTKIEGDGCEICNSNMTVTCVNCNVKICINHWDKHKAEIHMKGVSLWDLLKEVNTAQNGLDFKTSVRYLFKRV
jgi:hypothetical protein